MITWRIMTEGKCKKLADVPPGAEIIEVSGREVFGICETCGRPVLVGQDVKSDSDGVLWHDHCPKVLEEKK